VGSDETHQLMIIYSVLIKYLKKKLESKEVVHQLFIDSKKAYNSVRRD
jgi:hypothetical protein